MTYRDNVEHAATALARGEDANWELARLTFESTKDNRWDTDGVLMAEWCADVRQASGRKFGEASGRIYKAVWRRYQDQRVRGEAVDWVEAFQAVSRPEREPVEAPEAPAAPLTYEELREHLEAASDEAKQYAFRRLASEPAVIMEALAPGSPIANAVASLEHRAALHQERRYREECERDPIARSLDQGQASAELLSLCIQHARASERFAEQVAELLPRGGTLGADRLFWIQQAVDRLRGVLEQLDTYLGTGQTDLDAFVQGVLSGD